MSEKCKILEIFARLSVGASTINYVRDTFIVSKAAVFGAIVQYVAPFMKRHNIITLFFVVEGDLLRTNVLPSLPLHLCFSAASACIRHGQKQYCYVCIL